LNWESGGFETGAFEKEKEKKRKENQPAIILRRRIRV
jgi:hypothetical protein